MKTPETTIVYEVVAENTVARIYNQPADKGRGLRKPFLIVAIPDETRLCRRATVAEAEKFIATLEVAV